MSAEPTADTIPALASLLVESVEDYAIFMLDASGFVRSWNRGVERIKGYRAEELLGKHMSVFYTREDRERGLPTKLLERARAEGRVEDEGWRVRKDGTTFWAAVAITRVVDAQGRVVGFAKVTRDLTVRRRADEELRQSEERLRLMIESVHEYAICMLDPQGRVTSWNPGAERIFGYAARDIVGRHISVFYEPLEVEAGEPQRELSVAVTEHRFEEEGWRVRRDGGRFWAHVVLGPVYDQKGALLGFAKITRDMNERKRLEEESVARAHQQAAIADLSMFALQTRDVTLMMERAAAVVAATLDVDLTGVFELTPDEASLVLRAGLGFGRDLIGRLQMTASPETQAGLTIAERDPVVVHDRSNERRFAGTSLLPLHHVASGICVVVHGPRQIERPYGVFTAHAASPRAFSRDDVHFLESAANVVAAAIVRTRAETQLRVAEREVQHERDRSFEAHVALQQRDDFISVAAHELRTPLTALQLKLQGLDRATKKGAIDSACKSLLEARLDGALRQTARLADLVERLLDVSRIAGGRLEMHIEDTDLARIVARVIEDFGPSAAKAGSELRLAVRGPARGAWDRTRIEQVVVNLISNAIKYGAGKAIDIEVGGDARSVTLSVSDRGIGISDDDTRRIFERFERAVPMRYYGGLGLGLYVARQIVEAHGGTVKVSSCAGRGSTFLIDLPVAPRRA